MASCLGEAWQMPQRKGLQLDSTHAPVITKALLKKSFSHYSLVDQESITSIDSNTGFITLHLQKGTVQIFSAQQSRLAMRSGSICLFQECMAIGAHGNGCYTVLPKSKQPCCCMMHRYLNPQIHKTKDVVHTFSSCITFAGSEECPPFN